MEIFKNLTIVLVTFRSKEKLKILLNSLDRRFKVLVIENSQNYKYEKSLFKNKKIEIVYSSINKGFGTALNFAINKKIKTKLALYLSADVKITNNQIYSMYSQSKKVNKFSVITSKIKNENFSKYVIEQENKNLSKVTYANGCVMLIDTKIFKKLKGFDEKIFLYYEEIDFFKRSYINNYSIYLNHNITVQQQKGKSIDSKYLNDYLILRNWHYSWSKFYYYKKYHNYLFAFRKTFVNLRRSIFGLIKNIILFNYNEFKMNFAELSGLFSSYLNLKSYKRLKI